MQTAQSSTPRTPGGLATKLLYGLGSVAFGVKDNGFNVLLMLYYNQVLGLPAGMVGSAIMIALFADAFIDPVVGHLSDNCRSRWGRRHPFMYAATIPAALSYLALWNPPAGLSHAQLFWYLLVIAIVIRTCISCYEVPSAALAPELTHDYDQRTSLLSFRFFFGWWGGLGMGIAAFRIFLVPSAAYPIGQLNRDGYSAYGMTAALLLAASMSISALGTHAHIPHLAAPPPAQPFVLSRILAEARNTLANRAFLAALGNSAFGAMGLGIVAGMVLYINTYYWQLSSPQIAILMLGNLISAAIALQVAPRLCRRFEKKKALVASTAMALILGPSPIVLHMAGYFPGPGAHSLMTALFVATTATVSFTIISSILSTSMMADVVEDSQVKTGRRSEGLFFSATAFVFKCVSGVGVGVTGMILSLSQFPEGAKPGQVPADALHRMVVLQISFTAVLQLLAIACALLYPITRAIHQENLRRLGDRPERTSEPKEVLATASRASMHSSLRPVS